MSSDRLPLPLVVLLAFFGAAAVVGLPNGAPTAPAGKDPALAALAARLEPKPEADPEEDPLVILRQHFDTHVPQKAAKATGWEVTLGNPLLFMPASTRNTSATKEPSEVKGPDADSVRIPKGVLEDFEVLIATVPDPVDTKLAVEFDATIQAIQRAYEARDFVRDRSWMPWKREEVGTPPADPVHRRVPGAILFRDIKKPSGGDSLGSLAVVLLVGESPISGIHQPALTRALQLREACLARWRAVAPPPLPAGPIRLVAPFFSGSQGSLLRVLKDWQKDKLPRPEFDIIGGSATAVSADYFKADAGMTYRTTIVPNKLVFSAVIRYLSRTDKVCKKRFKALGKLAILRESNTGFGSRIGQSDEYKDADLIDLPFPSSISQIQIDLDKAAPASAAAGQVPTIQPDFVTPRLPTREETQVDGVPLYDRESATAIGADQLRDTLDVLNREDVRYVQIVATDNRDVVFLNRLLRKYCPGVRVFTTGPSAVLTLPSESAHMRGMIVGSTYSMSEEGQHWGNPAVRKRQPFAGQSQLGYYNAVLAHAVEKESDEASKRSLQNKMIEYRKPFSGDPGRGRPVIWVSVIGMSGELVPLAVYDDDDYDDPALYKTPLDLEKSPSQPPALAPTILFVGMLLAGMAVVFVALGLAGLERFRGTNAAWHLGVLTATERFKHSDDNLVRVRQAGVWLGIWLLAVPAFAVATAMAVLPLTDGGRLDRPGDAGLFVATILFWAVACMGSVAVARKNFRAPRWHVRYPGEKYRRARTGCAWAMNLATSPPALLGVVAAFSACWVGLAPHDTPLRSLSTYSLAGCSLLIHRVAEFSSGLSPLVPTALLAASLVVLCWANLSQVKLWRDSQHESPFPVASTGKVAVVADAVHREFGEGSYWLRARWRSVAYVGVPALLFTVWQVYAAHRTVEGRAWEVLSSTIFVLAGAAVVLTFARFLSLWSALKGLLEEVTHLRMAHGFKHLPDKVSRMFRGLMYTNHPQPADWLIPLQLLRELGEASPKAGSASFREELVTEAQVCINEVSTKLWEERSVDDAYGRDGPPIKEPGVGRKTSPASGEPEGLTDDQKKEVFAACVAALYVGQYFSQLRKIALSLTLGSPLLLLAAASYPFQPDRPLLNALTLLLVAVMGGILYVLFDVNRNELVSRIAKTIPNQFTPDRGFFSSAFGYVLPILGVVVAQLSGVFRIIAEPLLGSIR